MTMFIVPASYLDKLVVAEQLGPLANLFTLSR